LPGPNKDGTRQNKPSPFGEPGLMPEGPEELTGGKVAASRLVLSVAKKK